METTERVNPLKVLLSPRSVFPLLAERPSWGGFLALGAIIGFNDNVNQTFERSSREHPSGWFHDPFAPALLFSMLDGLLVFWLLSLLLPWAVQRVRAELTPASTRALLAWSALPNVVVTLWWLGLWLGLGSDFMEAGDAAFQASAYAAWFAFVLVKAVISVYWGLLLTLGIAAVARVTPGRALGAMLLTLVVATVINGLLTLRVFWSFRAALVEAAGYFGKW
jgi:hypothetical protein